MHNARKALSVVLAMAVMGSTCSCSAQFEKGALNQADKLGGYIQDRDYKKIEKMADGKDKDLEAILSLDSDVSSEEKEARELIASTLTYEVDEDSFEGDFFGKEGSVDVTFTYVDYEKATKDVDLFEDIEQFEALIEDCDDVIEETITFEFVKDGSSTVCTNIGDIAKLFPYAEEEFNFALSRDSYAGDIEFDGLNNGSGYIDAESISCHLNILGDGQELTWNYYYVVECYDVNLFTSEVTEVTSPTRLDAGYSEYDILEDGNYVFTFYTEDDLLLGMASVEVTHTEVTPTPTPAPSSGSNPVGPYFVCPYDGVVTFVDTDITLTLPYGHVCLDSDSTTLNTYFGSDAEFMQSLVFFSSSPIDGSGAFGVRLNFSSVDDPGAAQALQQAADAYAPSTGTSERTTSEYQLGDHTFTIETIVLTDSSGTVSYCNFVLIGDDDACYLVYFFSANDDIGGFMEGFNLG